MPLYRQKDASGFTLPTAIQTSALDSDYVLMIDGSGNPYKITKANLLAGLSSGNGGTSGGGGGSGSSTTDTYFADVVVLMPGSDLLNKSTHFTPNINAGSVTSSTTKSKWGGSSLRFPGSTFIDITDTNDFNVGGQDATIEMWFNPDATLASGNGQVLFEMRPDGGNGAFPMVSYDGSSLQCYFNGSTILNVSESFTGDTWYYVALKKLGTTTSLWLNGSQVGTFTSGDWGNSGRIALGALAFRSLAPSTYFVGYVDDFRFTLGQARDVSVVPTAAFPLSA
ncbi:MAG: LamG domain-containing protein [Nostoc sp.]|uniref:LamG domain-containing protein n=1 Tax=Nostoc sp. TaxID=1180 RepID=UPI002FF51C77